MKINNLNDFVRGWFVGGFEPTLIKTTDVEVAVQKFSAGDLEKEHYHAVATEITVLVKGKARIGHVILNEGDILTIRPGESADFEAIEDCTTVVVKHPGALNDKYLKECEC